MSERTWRIWACKKQDETVEEHRRGVPEWRLAQAVNWAAAKGYDTFLIEATDDPPTSTRYRTHHVCRDGLLCPGGCGDE